jgi:predicted nuclease with TOPRIM domain
MRSVAIEGLPMDEELASEIEDICTRLVEIQEEREHLPENEAGRREELLDEEHKLENRLAELEDRLAEEDAGVAEKRAADQTDLTRTPKLPDSENQP